jgi:hypothetical protein
MTATKPVIYSVETPEARYRVWQQPEDVCLEVEKHDPYDGYQWDTALTAKLESMSLFDAFEYLRDLEMQTVRVPIKALKVVIAYLKSCDTKTIDMSFRQLQEALNE